MGVMILMPNILNDHDCEGCEDGLGLVLPCLMREFKIDDRPRPVVRTVWYCQECRQIIRAAPVDMEPINVPDYDLDPLTPLQFLNVCAAVYHIPVTRIRYMGLLSLDAEAWARRDFSLFTLADRKIGEAFMSQFPTPL